MKTLLFFLAVAGWLVSILVHAAAIGGNELSTDRPYFIPLHVGIFVVWIPAILYLKKDEEYKKFQQSPIMSRLNPLKLIGILFRNCPAYFKAFVVIGFLYANLNIFLIMENLEENEATVRLFSGHWIGFYGIASGALYPFKPQITL